MMANGICAIKKYKDTILPRRYPIIAYVTNVKELKTNKMKKNVKIPILILKSEIGTKVTNTKNAKLITKNLNNFSDFTPKKIGTSNKWYAKSTKHIITAGEGDILKLFNWGNKKSGRKKLPQPVLKI